MLKYVAVAAALLVVAGPVYAGTPVLDQRQQNQAQRIRQGVHSGALTRYESARLVRGHGIGLSTGLFHCGAGASPRAVGARWKWPGAWVRCCG